MLTSHRGKTIEKMHSIGLLLVFSFLVFLELFLAA